MATVRLTLEDKQVIVNKAISRSVHMQQLQKQKVAGHVLADTVRIELLGGARNVILIDDLIKQADQIISKLPEVVHRQDRHYLSFSTHIRFTLPSTGLSESLELSERSYIPQAYSPTLENEKLEAMVIKHLELNQTLITKRKQLQEELWAILNQASTVKKLLTIWPEAKSLLTEEQLNPTNAPLPAEKSKELNRALNLEAIDD